MPSVLFSPFSTSYLTVFTQLMYFKINSASYTVNWIIDHKSRVGIYKCSNIGYLEAFENNLHSQTVTPLHLLGVNTAYHGFEVPNAIKCVFIYPPGDSHDK